MFERNRVLIGQMVRYGLAGGFLTVLVALGYWLIAQFGGIDPNISLLIVFIIASGIGYVLHSKVSFRDHGSRDQQHIRTIRFLIANVIGFASNQFFVWLLVKQLDGPTWWPTIPIILFTPWLTFVLHRKWTFA